MFRWANRRALLAEAGVTGFDSELQRSKLPELAKTGLKPINFFGWPKFLGPDGGAKDSDEFVAAAVKYGVPRIMVVPDEFSKDGGPGGGLRWDPRGTQETRREGERRGDNRDG